MYGQRMYGRILYGQRMYGQECTDKDCTDKECTDKECTDKILYAKRDAAFAASREGNMMVNQANLQWYNPIP